jgi:hypothetical protein
MKEEIKERIERCLERLTRDDRELLENDVNERSLTHKLAEYLQAEFTEWNLDCEYNRKYSTPNRLVGHPFTQKGVPPDDVRARTVYPDIIVHHRNTDENLLVIEVKKASNPDGLEFDKWKLEGFRDQLGYRHTAFLVVTDAKEFCLEIDGKPAIAPPFQGQFG